MSDTEKLHIKIGLYGTYWDKKPQYSIAINDTVLVDKADVVTNTDEVFYIEFDCDITDGTNILKIRLENKDWTDTIQNDNKTEILKDMLLGIKSVEIDEIGLGELVWKTSVFTGDDSSRPVLTKCVDLGWNGTWALEFTSPFYIWLLENI
jgi:hypothetical protein